MARKEARLPPLYHSGIQRIKDAGVELTPDDYVAVWEAAKRCVEGDGSLPALLETSVQIGNVTLHPRTLGAALWWDTKAKAWFEGSDSDAVIALAWMLANSNDQKLFARIKTKAQAIMAILKWQLGVASNVTLAQLAWGVTSVLNQRYVADLETGEGESLVVETDWGAVIAKLCATYHQPPEYFLWGLGERVAVELYMKAPRANGETTNRDYAAELFGDVFLPVVNGIIARAKEAKE